MSDLLNEKSTFGNINKDWDKNQQEKKPFSGLGSKFEVDFDLKDYAKTVKSSSPSGRHDSSNVETDNRSNKIQLREINQTTVTPFKPSFDLESLAKEVDRFRPSDNKLDTAKDVDSSSKVSGRHDQSDIEPTPLKQTDDKTTAEISDDTKLSGRHEESGVDVDSSSKLSGRHEDSDIEAGKREKSRFNEESDIDAVNKSELTGRHTEGKNVEPAQQTDDKTETAKDIEGGQLSGRHDESGIDVDKNEQSIDYQNQSPDVGDTRRSQEKPTPEVSRDSNPSGRHEDSNIDVNRFDPSDDKEDAEINNNVQLSGRHTDSDINIPEFNQTDDKSSVEINDNQTEIDLEGTAATVNENYGGTFDRETPDINENYGSIRLENADRPQIDVEKFNKTIQLGDDTIERKEVGSFSTVNLADRYNSSDESSEGNVSFSKLTADIKSDNRLSRLSQNADNFGRTSFPTGGSRTQNSNANSDILNRFQENENSIYNKFNLSDDGVSGLQDFYANGFIDTVEIKPNDPKSIRDRTKYDTRLAPLGSAARDSRRIASFLSSPRGALFLTQQGFLQQLNPMRITRKLKAGWLADVVSPNGGIFDSIKDGLGLEGARHGGSFFSLGGAPTYEDYIKRQGSEIEHQVSDKVFENVSGLTAAQQGLVDISRNMRQSDPDKYSGILNGGKIELARDQRAVLNNRYNKSLVLKKDTSLFLNGGSVIANKYHPGLKYVRSAKKRSPNSDSARINSDDASTVYDGTQNRISPIIDDQYEAFTGNSSGIGLDQQTQVNDTFTFDNQASEGSPSKNYREISDASERSERGEKVYEKDVQRADSDNTETINNTDSSQNINSTNGAVSTISDKYSKLLNNRVYGNQDPTGSHTTTFDKNASTNKPSNRDNYNEEIKSYSTKNYQQISDVSRDFGQGNRASGYGAQSGSLETDYAFGNPGAVVDSQRYDDGVSNLPVLEEDDGASSVYNTERIKDKYGSNFNVKVNKIKDFIPFKFFDVNNEKYLVFRATLGSLSENASPNWSNINYVGRPDTYYIYQNSNRSLSFDFKLYPNSSKDMQPMWSKLNYLTSLTYPHLVNDTDATFYYRSPFTRLTIGDMYKEQYGFINSLDISIPDDGVWELGNVLGNDETLPVLPQYIDISIGYQIIEDEFPRIGGKMYDIPRQWRSY